MALIGQIREKSSWAIGIIAFGLILFIIGGDVLSPSSFILGKNQQVVGEIAGEEIHISKFQNELNEMKNSYYLNTNKIPGEEENQQFLPQAWNQLFFKIAYQKEYDALGLVVGQEEQIDMVQGRNIHPAILQSFRNPNTGQFDKNMIINYLQNLSKLEQKQQAIWVNFEKNLPVDRLRMKYENLIRKSAYVTKAEAKREYTATASRAEIKYVNIPFSVIQDGEVPINEDDIAEFAKNNPSRFILEPSANIQYVAFPIIPSQADTMDFMVELAKIKEEFRNSDDDSLFVAINADNPSEPFWMNPGQLPKGLQNIGKFQKDSLYGPVVEGNVYKIFKVTNLKDDTAYAARASHILFRWENDSPEAKAATLARCKDILKQIMNGGSFEMMAQMYGTDGSAQQGGDLGWFGQGQMVKSFEQAVFAATKAGVLPDPVETQFGYHIIKVTEPKTNKKYFVAQVDKAISAGDKTRDSVFKKAEKFAVSSIDISGMDLALKDFPGYYKNYVYLTPGHTALNNLQNPKEVIRWTFLEAKEGDISPVIEVDNNYVVSALSEKYEYGTVNIKAYQQQIVGLLYADKKAAKILEKIGADNNNLDDAAKKIGNNIMPAQFMDLNLAQANINPAGFEPEGTGVAFALAEGKSYKGIKGSSGVILVQTQKKYMAPDIADYSYFRNQLMQQSSSRGEYTITEAIREKAKLKDYRYKFF
ncbi:MAG: SurA N-terminal domain-containing protein [Cytophagales bacterium]|nr:SurA N-terminal domain-containing protein [Cytophagales bacterium]